MARRRFGRVRRLPSGRWQARYPGPDGIDRPAPMTFATKTEAARWLALIEAELIRDEWINPRHGEIPLREYALVWLKERPGLRPKTVVLYDGLIRNHIAPTGAILAARRGLDVSAARDFRLGDLPLGALSPDRIRAWRAALLGSGVSVTTAAKAYRLLRAILATAVDDGLIRRNP